MILSENEYYQNEKERKRMQTRYDLLCASNTVVQIHTNQPEAIAATLLHCFKALMFHLLTINQVPFIICKVRVQVCNLNFS